MKIRRLAPLLVVSATIPLFFLWKETRDPSTGTNKDPLKASNLTSVITQRITKSHQDQSSNSSPTNKDDLLKDARRRLTAARNVANITERTIECSKIIGDLCKSGYSEEAWQLIDSKPGQVRNSEISQFFRYSKLTPDQVASRIELLSNKEEAGSAFSGYLESMGIDGIVTYVESPDFSKLSAKLATFDKGIVGNVISGKLQGVLEWERDPQKKAQAVETAVLYHTRGILTDRSLSWILLKDDSKSSFEKFGILSEKTKPSLPQTETGKMRRSIIDKMIEEDAQKAMASVLSVKGYQGTVDIMQAITKFGVADPHSANAWFEDNQNRMEPIQKDAAALGFWRLALVYREKETAEKWLQQVNDKKLKEWAMKNMVNQNK